MYGRTDIPMIMAAIIFCMVVTVGVLFGLGSSGKIIIEKPYLQDYEQTKAKLDQCIASKIPACAPCECNPGATGIVWSIMGFAAMIGGYLFGSMRIKSLDKQEEKLNDLEKALEKKQNKS